MGEWIKEAANGFGLTLEIEKQLLHRETPFQVIDLYQTSGKGKLLMLNGIIQLTSWDEFCYHEMMAHTVMCACADTPEKVLVVGGGDGGVLRELAKYPSVKRLDICEIDEAVIEAAKEFLPETAVSYNDPRVNIHIADGSEFIKQFNAEYDAIIVDSTDPGGPGEPLFGVEFYRNMRKALKSGGVIGSQSESPFLLPDVVKSLQDISRQCFEYSAYGMFYVPTYPTGNIGICVGGAGIDPTEVRRQAPAGLRYYNEDIHRAAFVLPQFVRELLGQKK